MTRQIALQPLTASAFAPFGEVLEVTGAPDKMINAGLCGRHHDRAVLDFSDGRAGISLFDAEPRQLPYAFDLVERHPDGSQAFIPMHPHPFLVVVAPDDNGTPGTPMAFVTNGAQGINFHRNVWHGVLSPLPAPNGAKPGLFAVVDRIGDGPNLQEYTYPEPWIVHP